MLLGPKITNVTKYGAKVSIRFPLMLWLLDRKFANDMKDMVGNAWQDSHDIMNFRSMGGGRRYVLRVERSDSALLKISWF